MSLSRYEKNQTKIGFRCYGYARPKVALWGMTPSVPCYILNIMERIGHRGKSIPGYLLKRFDFEFTGVLAVHQVDVIELFDTPRWITAKEMNENYNQLNRR